MKIWSSGFKASKSFKVKPLTEAKAIETGADLLGEGFIFSVAAGKVVCFNEA